MFDEGPQERRVALERAGMAPSCDAEGGDVDECRIGEGIGFEVVPDVFDGIELRRVGGEDDAPGCREGAEERSDGRGPMRLEAVPHHEKRRALQLGGQVPEKRQHTRGVDVGVRVQAEVAGDVGALC